MFDIVPQLVANSVIAGSLYALAAMSFTFIYRPTKFINLAHGSIATIAAYAVFCAGSELGMPVVGAVIAGVMLAGIAGYVMDMGLFSRLRARRATVMTLLVASLGIATVVQAVLSILFSTRYQTLTSLVPTSDVVHVGPAVMTSVQLITLICAFLVAVVLMFVLSYTRFGKAYRATSDDSEVARTVGIDTVRTIRQTFLIGSVIMGVAGIMSSFDVGFDPTIGLGLLMKGIIAAIVGGIGSIPGALMGAYLLGFSENFGVWYLTSDWKDAIAYIILVIFLLFRPEGIIRPK